MKDGFATQGRTKRAALAILAVAWLSGCGSDAQPKTPTASQDAPPTTVSEAEAQLAAAEDQVRLSLGSPRFATAPTQVEKPRAPSAAEGQADAARPAPPAAPPVTVDQRPKALEEAPHGGLTSRPEDPCAVPCNALASMTRAADHLCQLTGEGDAKCSNARTRVRSATDRVHAECPRCSG